jgi:hypothetical protein
MGSHPWMLEWIEGAANEQWSIEKFENAPA